MNSDKLRRFGWAVYLFVGALAIIMFLAATSMTAREGPFSDLLLNLSADLLGVALIFFLVRQFFLWRPEDEQWKQLDSQLSKMSRVLEQAKDVVPAVQILPTRKAVYDLGISVLEDGQWEKVRIFAPVGLWREDEDKRQWLEAVAKHAKPGGRVKTVWGVFGLPPKTKDGETRPYDHVVEDLNHARKTLGLFGNLKNVVLHYYPPFHAAVGLGAIIFENVEKTGGELAFALSTHSHETVIDAGFGVNNKELFFIARQWFDEQIFLKATRMFILHDDDKSIEERWANIVETWYGKEYLPNNRFEHQKEV